MSRRTVALAVFFLAIGIAAAADRVEAQTRPQHPILDSLASFYNKAPSVYLRASLDVSVRLPLYEGHAVPVNGQGVIEHWEQDGRFRTKIWVDPRVGLAENVEIAYDGTNYRLYWPDVGTLAVEEPRFMAAGLLMVPGPVPNPFYLPVAHLVPSDDGCPGCQLTLSYLKNPENWAEKMSALYSSADSVFNLPGGTRAGEPYTFEVAMKEVDSAKEAKKAFSTLHWVYRKRPDGKIISSIHLEDMMDVTTRDEQRLQFPRTIEFAGYDPDQPRGQHLVTLVDYVIEHLEVGSDFEDVFQLEGEPTVSAWEQGELTAER